MKKSISVLAAGLLASSLTAWAQPTVPRNPDSTMPTPSERGMRGPADKPVKPPSSSGMRTAPDSSMKTPSDPGMVVEPPKTGTGAEAIKTPPKNIDPEITGATEEIDKKNREKSQQKQKAR